MKLAFSKATATAEEQRELFGNFRRFGYQGLQVKPGQYNYTPDPARFLADWPTIRETGSALIGYGKLEEQDIANVRRAFAFGAAIGAGLFVYCLGIPCDSIRNDRSGNVARCARQCSELGRMALSQGIKLSIHNHFDSPVMTRDDLRIFYDAVAPGTVGLTVDTAHLVKSGVADIAAIIKEYRSVIDNFHLKDIAHGSFQVLGAGEIDFGPVFDAIKGTGFDGWVSCDEESGTGMLASMESCAAFMRAGLM